MGASVFHGGDLARHAAFAEAAGHQDSVRRFEGSLDACGRHVVGVDPAGLDPDVVGDPAMGQRLAQRFVGVAQAGVLADDRDRDLPFRGADAPHDLAPRGEIRRRRVVDAEMAHDLGVEPPLVVADRDFVDAVHVDRRDHAVLAHVAEARDLPALGGRNRAVRPAQEEVRRDADAAQLLHRMLRGLGLQLAGGRDVGDEGEMDEHRLVPAPLVGELADRFVERQALDVADRAADLDQHEIGAVGVADDRLLDRVGDVGDDLHRPAEIVAPPLAGDHGLVDAAGGDAVAAPRRHAREAFVVAQVEIGLGAVVRDVDLAVLERAHRSGIDVEVGVEFTEPDPVAARLEERAEGRRREPLAEGGGHAAGHEDIPRHGPRP